MISTPIAGTRSWLLPILLFSFLFGVHYHAPAAHGQGREEGDVRASIAVLNEIMTIPAQRIPQRMLAGAEGIAIIPNVIKGGFVIGARHGRGTLLIRDENSSWHAPVFVSLTGGSIGWQVGVQSTDVILVFKTKKSVQGILSGKFTLGVDAAAAAGPVGRQASAATDLQLKAEVYSYARSRGLFLGASFDGSMLSVDGMGNSAYYRSAGPGLPVAIPPSAQQLVQTVAQYSGGSAAPAPTPTTTATGVAVPATPSAVPPLSAANPALAPTQSPIPAQQYATNESDVIRDQLGKISPELFEKIDPAWKTYLALPAEVFSRQGHPTVATIQQSLQHYEQVQQDPKYQALASMPEFQSTVGLLKHYLSSLGNGSTSLNIPPPPGSP
jgi:lipid-binding SYLF domain-containing protein